MPWGILGELAQGLGGGVERGLGEICQRLPLGFWSMSGGLLGRLSGRILGGMDQGFERVSVTSWGRSYIIALGSPWGVRARSVGGVENALGAFSGLFMILF